MDKNIALLFTFVVIFFAIIGVFGFLLTSFEIINIGQEGIKSAKSGDTQGMSDSIVSILVIFIIFALGSIAFISLKKGRK